MRLVGRLALAMVLSVPVVIQVAAPVAACTSAMPSTAAADYRGLTLRATVREIVPAGAGRTTVVLDIERTFAGPDRDTLRITTATGTSGEDGCGSLRADRLTEGQLLMVSARGTYKPDGTTRDFRGYPLLWRHTADGWSFFKGALVEGGNPDAYPPKARRADTKAEILAVSLGSTAQRAHGSVAIVS